MRPSCHMAAFSQPQPGIDFSNVWLHMLETMISETQINGHIYWLHNKISLEFNLIKTLNSWKDWRRSSQDH